jgi:hypothetical protein
LAEFLTSPTMPQAAIRFIASCPQVWHNRE